MTRLINKQDFQDWFIDGNVIRLDNKYFSTQCAQWKNKLTFIGLVRYYYKEFINV